MELKRKLNIGAGEFDRGLNNRRDYLNVDIVKTKGIHKVVDLNKFPYPFEDNHFEEILAIEVLDHLDDIMKVMQEMHRILKPGGKIIISVPYFTSNKAWIHPQHKRAFSYETFDFFVVDKMAKMEDERTFKQMKFSKIKKKLILPKGLHFYNYLFEPIVNAIPYLWENTILRDIFRADGVYVELTK